MYIYYSVVDLPVDLGTGTMILVVYLHIFMRAHLSLSTQLPHTSLLSHQQDNAGRYGRSNQSNHYVICAHICRIPL